MQRRDCLKTGLKLSALGALTLLGTAAWAQAPTHVKGPVRITSTLPSGSGPDVVARLVADKLQTRWSMPVVVDPKPGGAGAV
ncbi:tripartite tricarboxylate transporter substrate binding protein, partial [Variovorax sp. HJSM1_2]